MTSVYRDLLKKGLIYGLGSSLNGLAAFFLIPFVIRHLSALEYGRFAVAEIYLNLLLVFASLGTNVSLITQYMVVPDAHRATLFRSCIVLVGAFSTVLVCSISGLLAGLGYWNIHPVPGGLWWLIAIIVPVEALWTLFSSLYRAQANARRFLLLSVLQLIISCACTVALVLFSGQREAALLSGRAIASTSVLLLAAVSQRELIGKVDWTLARGALKVGLPLVPATFSAIWLAMAPRALLGLFSSETQVGIYAMASRIAGIVNLAVIQPFGTLWVPAAFRIKERQDAVRIFDRVLNFYIFFAGGIAGSIALIAPTITAWLQTSAFPLEPNLVGLVAVGLSSLGLSYAVNLGPYFFNRTGQVLPAYLTAAALSILLGVPLVMTAGAYGAAFLLLFCYLAQAAMLYKISGKIYPIQYDGFANLVTIGGIGLGYFVAAHFCSQIWAVPVFALLAIGSWAIPRMGFPALYLFLRNTWIDKR